MWTVLEYEESIDTKDGDTPMSNSASSKVRMEEEYWGGKALKIRAFTYSQEMVGGFIRACAAGRGARIGEKEGTGWIEVFHSGRGRRKRRGAGVDDLDVGVDVSC